jgi:hypothetical protein
MKRNNDLLREILLELNKTDEPTQLELYMFPDLPELTSDSLDDHVHFLQENGLIEPAGVYLKQLTWFGYDFVGYSSDTILWRAATRVAGHLSFDAFYAILKDLMFWKARKVAEEFSKGENGYKHGKRK